VKKLDRNFLTNKRKFHNVIASRYRLKSVVYVLAICGEQIFGAKIQTTLKASNPPNSLGEIK
jgi:hypothetical protein